MSSHPFASFNPKPSHWGYNWTAEPATIPEPVKHREAPAQVSNHCQSSSPEPQMLANQYAHLPAALLSTMKRDKKPFTYTPGGVNLSEVLNARLQKRMERKKKYSEERTISGDDGLPRFDPPKQMIVMPTYNTPLDMYSMENALEVLEAQAELVSADKSLSSTSRSATLPRNHTFRFEDDMDPGRGVAQSKAFKVLQIITDTEEEPASDKGRPQHRDEMRFTGIRESKAIPSKFFHTLQKITGTEDDEQEECQTREMQQAAPLRMAPFEKQTSGAKPQFVAHNSVAPLQSQQPNNSPALKRPAAFLPIKTTPGSGFRAVQPPTMSNGSMRRVGNLSAGTDF